MNRKMSMIGKRTGRLLVVVTGCLFFLYIGACGLPVSIQLHCLMLPYSMQKEDTEKGIYKGITGCMPLYAYAKEQVEVEGQDLATTYILLEGRDESHEVLQGEREAGETIDENVIGSNSNSDGQMDRENDQLVSNDGDTEKAQSIQVGKNDNTNVEEVVESKENTQSEQDESSDTEDDRENADIDAMTSENQ